MQQEGKADALDVGVRELLRIRSEIAAALQEIDEVLKAVTPASRQ